MTLTVKILYEIVDFYLNFILIVFLLESKVKKNEMGKESTN